MNSLLLAAEEEEKAIAAAEEEEGLAVEDIFSAKVEKNDAIPQTLTILPVLPKCPLCGDRFSSFQSFSIVFFDWLIVFFQTLVESKDEKIDRLSLLLTSNLILIVILILSPLPSLPLLLPLPLVHLFLPSCSLWRCMESNSIQHRSRLPSSKFP